VHELSIAESVVRIAEQHAAGRPVAVVELKVGHLRQVVPSALAFAFELVAQGTCVEGADLVMEEIRAAGRCRGCGTELSGLFAACSFCGLTDVERDLLSVFLASRGNMRRVEKHLGVSYPTARQRFADVLAKLGIAEDTPEAVEATGSGSGPVGAEPPNRDLVLARLAAGEITVDEAERLLREHQ